MSGWRALRHIGAAASMAAVGAACSEPVDRFDRPTNVAFGTDGTIFVADGYEHAHVVRFAADGRVLGEFGERGVGPGQFETPHGIAADGRGRVYVADRENARVQIFDEQGRFLAQWRGPELGRPWNVAVGPDGFVYVVDGGDQDPERPRGAVIKLDREGRIVARFGAAGNGPGTFEWAHHVAVGRDGSVYVADVEGRRIQKFRPR